MLVQRDTPAKSPKRSPEDAEPIDVLGVLGPTCPAGSPKRGTGVPRNQRKR